MKGAMMGNRPLRWFSGKWIRVAVISAFAAGLFAIPAVATAGQHPGDADFGYIYNPETDELGFWFGPSDADVVCAWSDSLVEEPIPEVGKVPETQCLVVDAVGPNGQVNHGTVISALVHGVRNLIDASGNEAPRGQFVSEVASGDSGKGNEDDASSSPVDKTADSRGSKSRGIGSPGNVDGSVDDGSVDDGDSPDVVEDAHDGDTEDISDVDGGDDAVTSNADSGGDKKGKSEDKSNAGGNGNGSSNANENAKGEGIGKGG